MRGRGRRGIFAFPGKNFRVFPSASGAWEGPRQQGGRQRESGNGGA
ncbi:hypothetical protein CLS_15270 [[Clostridium] cf. saccharolyticum K10]|nr:hypothetical protein CLS_15270 [[Clostridium] cf. saccharolyticum K10]